MKMLITNADSKIYILLKYKLFIILLALIYAIGISHDLKNYEQNFKRPNLYQVTTRIAYPPSEIENQDYTKKIRQTIRQKIKEYIIPQSINAVLGKNKGERFHFDLTSSRLINTDTIKSTTSLEGIFIVEAIHDAASEKISAMFPNENLNILRIATYNSLGAKPQQSIFSEFIVVPLFVIGLIFSSIIALFINSLLMLVRHQKVGTL